MKTNALAHNMLICQRLILVSKPDNKGFDAYDYQVLSTKIPAEEKKKVKCVFCRLIRRLATLLDWFAGWRIFESQWSMKKPFNYTMLCFTAHVGDFSKKITSETPRKCRIA